MDRRGFVAAGGAALAGGCAATVSTRRGTPAPEDLILPVRASPDRVIRTVVGLRPYRPSGFRVETESLAHTTVVHNYGHGGAGVTLSWGTADLAANLALGTGHRDVAVIGAGVVGLSTALLLQERGARVTMYARDLPPNTTSNVAGAQWAPYTIVDEEFQTPRFGRQLKHATEFAFRRFQDYAGPEYGVYWRRNFAMRDAPQDGPDGWVGQFVRDLYAEQATLGPGQHPFPSPYVYRFTTMHIEPAVYLRGLLRDFFTAGGDIRIAEFNTLGELDRLPAPVAVNCTGLGAAALAGDATMIPIKGQLTALLPQPGVNYITLAGGLYMMPRSDGIMLGGTFERGVDTLTVNQDAQDRIVRGHQTFFEEMRRNQA